MLNDSTLKELPVKYIKITKKINRSVEHFINEIQTSNILSDIKLNFTQDPNINYNIMHDVIQYAKPHICHKRYLSLTNLSIRSLSGSHMD